MTHYLPHIEFVPEGEDLEYGEQIHINHQNCDAGVDTKRRLYIKRGDDNGTDAILAHCHHCGKSGYYNATNAPAKPKSKRNKPLGNGGHVALPRDFTKDWNDWPKQARIWIGVSGVGEATAHKWGIGYSKEYNRVVVPSYRNGELLGYQLRSLDKEDQPKYITYADEKPLYWYSGRTCPTLVIVEDVLSAIRCSEHVDAAALLGSDINDTLYALIAEQGYENFLIFLDNDNRQVKLNQMRIKRKLDILGNTRIIKESKDPKCFDSTELKRILTC